MGIWNWLRKVVTSTPSGVVHGVSGPAAERTQAEPTPSATARAAKGATAEGTAQEAPTTPTLATPSSWPSTTAPLAVRRDEPRSASARGASLPDDLLQFAGARRGTETDIVIGFDLGTSSAKVVLQTPYALGGRIVAADFGPLGHSSSTYLLPVSVFRDAAGGWTLVRPGHTAEHRCHLKLPLLGEIRNGETPDPETAAWAVAFVALALREARRVFLGTQSDTYGGIRFRWAMNVGIPSAGYDDERIRSRFGLVARAAWLASLSPVITQTTVDAAVAQAGQGDIAGMPIAVVPEVAAEMVGYARSRFRREGLHAVVDVGASTLDICGIELFADAGDDRYDLLTADVRDLGFLELHARRTGAVGGQPPFDGTPSDLVGPLVGLMDAPAGLRAAISYADSGYIEEASRVLVRTLAWLYCYRAPGAPAWQEGLPLFVTGGGADSPVLKRIVKKVDEQARAMWVNYTALVAQPLPIALAVGPEQETTRQRLVVAYGLSYPEISIGTIVPPSELANPEPVLLPRRDWQHAYIDK